MPDLGETPEAVPERDQDGGVATGVGECVLVCAVEDGFEGQSVDADGDNRPEHRQG